MNDVTGDWTKFHNEKLHDLFTSPNIMRVSQVTHVGKYRNAYKVCVGNDEGKTLLGIPRHRCEDNIKRALKK
jgi:hypothetical protein